MNPEFVRNLWLELSLTRVLAAALALAAIFTLVFQIGHGWESLRTAARVVYVIVVFVWGGYRSVGTISDEIAERTWDWQRMSALGPWRIAWGKLLGGNIMVWIVGMACLAVMVYAENRYIPASASLANAWTFSAILIGSGVLLHGFAMAIALSALRKVGASRRVATTLPKLLVLVIAVLLAFFFAIWGIYDFDGKSTVHWFFWTITPDWFSVITIWLFAIWAVIAVYRMMRAELQHRTIAWGWLAFTLFLTLYSIGLIVDVNTSQETPDRHLVITFQCAVIILYIALFTQKINITGYHALFDNWKRGRAGLHLIPSWIPILILLACLAVAMSIPAAGGVEPGVRLHGELAAFLREIRAFSPIWVWAVVLFVMRDSALLLFLNFNANARRPNSAAFLYLLLAYTNFQ